MFPQGNIKDWRIWWQLFKRRWFILCGCIMIGIGIGLYFAFTIPPEYESSSTVMVLDTDLLSGSRIITPRITPRQEIEYFRRRLTSIDFLARLIDSLDMKNNPKIMAMVNQLTLSYPDVPRAEIEKQVCLKHLNKKISSRMKTYNIVEIKARGKSSKEAYHLCNMITNLSISESQKSQIQSASLASSFSSELLDIYKNRLAEAEDRLEKFNSRGMNKSDDDVLLSQEKLQKIQSTILSSEIDIQVKSDKIQEVDSTLYNISEGYKTELEESLSDLKAKVVLRTNNVCQFFKQFDWQDIEIVLLHDEIAKLKKNINDRTRNIISEYCYDQPPSVVESLIELENMRIELSFSQCQKETFASIIKAHNDYLKSQPSREATGAQLEREVAITRETYDLLSRQARGTQIRESAQQQEAQLRFRLLMPPQQTLERVKPSRKKILFIALFLGMTVGLGIIFGLENINTTFTSVEQVTGLIKIPVIATIPKIEPIRKREKQNRLN